jgi:hypothetical protein
MSAALPPTSPERGTEEAAMTDHDPIDTAPGKGDPTRSDDTASPGLRSDTAGSGRGDPDVAAPDADSAPAPHAGSFTDRRTEPTDWLRTADGDAPGSGRPAGERTDADPAAGRGEPASEALGE